MDDISLLYLEYARVIEMCRGTELENTPWKCVRNKIGEGFYEGFDDHPSFIISPEKYEFALNILKNKAVFVGSVLYDPRTLASYDVNERGYAVCREDGTTFGNMLSLLTWDKPDLNQKRTFTLHGGGMLSGYQYGDLPCPVDLSKIDSDRFNSGDYYPLLVGRRRYYFECKDDAQKVFNALTELLGNSFLFNT